jgi:hypothetical protein
MSRKKIFAVLTTVAVLITTACADVTGPTTSRDVLCPVSGGPDCTPH